MLGIALESIYMWLGRTKKLMIESYNKNELSMSVIKKHTPKDQS